MRAPLRGVETMEPYAGSKLTVEHVREIRKAHAQGVIIAVLARRYGVSHTAVRFIVNGWTWRWVPEEGARDAW